MPPAPVVADVANAVRALQVPEVKLPEVKLPGLGEFKASSAGTAVSAVSGGAACRSEPPRRTSHTITKGWPDELPGSLGVAEAA